MGLLFRARLKSQRHPTLRTNSPPSTRASSKTRSRSKSATSHKRKQNMPPHPRHWRRCRPTAEEGRPRCPLRVVRKTVARGTRNKGKRKKARGRSFYARSGQPSASTRFRQTREEMEGWLIQADSAWARTRRAQAGAMWPATMEMAVTRRCPHGTQSQPGAAAAETEQRVQTNIIDAFSPRVERPPREQLIRRQLAHRENRPRPKRSAGGTPT